MAKSIGGTKTVSTGKVENHIATPNVAPRSRGVAGKQGKVVTGRVANHVGRPAPMHGNGGG